MKEYEQISENCKMLWRDGFILNDLKHTQVSCYVFNENNQLLIVKNENTWTIPGGHPEEGETTNETLTREIMEEACITVNNVSYLGAVEVIDGDDEPYYQLRYTAKVEEILPFKQEWEISERKFVDLDDLSNYISWANGLTFSSQIESARNFWKI